MKTFLHVGCGKNLKHQTTPHFALPPWREIRVDIDPTVEPDVLGSMIEMSEIAAESADAIFSSHNIEHLYPHEVPLALSEFLRVLNKDGYLVLTCPDLKAICQLVADDKLTEAAYQSPLGPITPLDVIYGYRPDLAAGNHYMAHRCGFTECVLVNTLQAAGFKSIASVSYPHRFDLWAIATKSEMPEAQLRELAIAHFPRI